MIEFIAGHALQAQCAESVFTELSKTHACRWRIGRRMPASSAEAAVLIDHTQNHPNVVPSWRGYQHAFYMMHDLGDLGSYMRSRKTLRRFDAVFVPDGLHERWATEALRRSVPIEQVGWPKFDPQTLSPEHEAALQKIKSLPQDVPTVLYAPNCPTEESWRQLWETIKDASYNVIVKNATYGVAPGEAVPHYYQTIIRTIDRMEEQVRRHGRETMVVTPRDMNVCAIFPYAQLMLSSKSSVLAEFLSFGTSVETDIPFPPECDSPLISQTYTDIQVLSQQDLLATLSSADQLRRFLKSRPATQQQPGARSRYPNEQMTSGERTADRIRHYLTQPAWQRRWRRVYAAARL